MSEKPEKYSTVPAYGTDHWHDSFMRKSIDKEKYAEGHEAIFGTKKFAGRKGTYRGAGPGSDLEEADRGDGADSAKADAEGDPEL